MKINNWCLKCKHIKQSVYLINGQIVKNCYCMEYNMYDKRLKGPCRKYKTERNNIYA